MMKTHHPQTLLSLIFLSCLSTAVHAGQNFTDAGTDHLWSTPENWSTGVVPDDSTTFPGDLEPQWHTDIQMVTDGTTAVIDSTIDAQTYSLHVGAFGGDNTFEMTGGSLTVGAWGLNVGRGGNRTQHEGSFGHMIMSGGEITAPFFIVPEQFVGGEEDHAQQGEVMMSGGTINANWMRIGGKIGVGTVELSGTATINLSSHLEMNPDFTGEAALDLRDGAVLNILGTPDVNPYLDFIDAGWLTANGGTTEPVVTDTDEMLTISAGEPTAVPGDFNGDGLCTSEDIDLLAAAIRNGDTQPSFDLDGNGNVDAVDHEFMIHEIKNTLFGDADLNQAVEFADFLALSDSFGETGGWAEGDFDGDGEVMFADFLTLSANFGEATAADTAGSTSTVPEPTTSSIIFGILLGCLMMRKRAV